MRIRNGLLISAAATLALTSQVALAEDTVGYGAIRSQDWATAERQLLAGLQKNPDNVFRQLNLAWVYAQTGRKDQAAEIYRRIMSSDDNRFAALPSREAASVKALAERGLSQLAQ